MNWWVIAFFSVIDVIAAIAFSQLDDSQDKAFMFVMALAFLWLVPLAIGAWSLAKFWIGYHLFLKRKMVRVFKSSLHKHKFPSASEHFDTRQFLSSVMDDDHEPLKTKLNAAYLASELDSYRLTRPWTLGIAADLAFQQAMEEFQPSSAAQAARP